MWLVETSWILLIAFSPTVHFWPFSIASFGISTSMFTGVSVFVMLVDLPGMRSSILFSRFSGFGVEGRNPRLGSSYCSNNG